MALTLGENIPFSESISWVADSNPFDTAWANMGLNAYRTDSHCNVEKLL